MFPFFIPFHIWQTRIDISKISFSLNWIFMKFFSSVAFVLLIGLISCKSKMQPVAHVSDYGACMNAKSPSSLRSLRLINTDIAFWSDRLKKGISFDPVARVKLAGLYASRFKVAGNIHDIHTSDSLYLLANPLIKPASSTVYRSLAANCITQHKFKQAKLYIDTALSMGDEKYTSLLMQCDVWIELGNLLMAKNSLNQIKDKNDFDYLIREAKLLDHEGNLPGAIKRMEKAVEQVASSKNDKLFRWAKTNLADMYGHDNRYADAYRCYVDVLNKEPEDLYALKGIAWLVFSHDRNSSEAKRILNYLSSLHPVPDYDLMLARIAEYENNNEEKQRLEKKFLIAVANPLYGDMYNKYLFYLAVDEMMNVDQGIAIAEREVNNRPTPESYDLLAWAKFKQGKRDEALSIVESFVAKRNFEPDAQYHLGVIYASAGNFVKAKNYLKQAAGSAFELGPEMESLVEAELKKL
jgi:tetratricopeptide (TPR) repeat protein